MRAITFIEAHDIPQALTAHGGRSDTAYLAGGTTLVDLMKLDVMRPAHLVDVSTLDQRAARLSQIARTAEGGVRIGALVSNSAVAHHPIVIEQYPVLSQAILAGATVQIRNMATVGGNLLQRTRCPYFRDTASPCNKREPGTGCAALEGYNRSHAILGGSDKCIATHPSDMCVALAALDAVVRVAHAGGERTVPFTEFHTLPADQPERENVLAPGELIVGIDLPALSYARRSAYLKVRDRTSYAFALASVAALLDIANGTIRAARLALGGIGTRPWRAVNAERVLVGQPAGDPAYNAAADAALMGAQPRRFNAFKADLAHRAIVRTLRLVGALA